MASPVEIRHDGDEFVPCDPDISFECLIPLLGRTITGGVTGISGHPKCHCIHLPDVIFGELRHSGTQKGGSSIHASTYDKCEVD